MAEYIISSGENSSGIILNNDAMTVLHGGTANDTSILLGGRADINGGTANRTTINSGGYLEVKSGGTADHATANSRGDIGVHFGGTANDITLNYFGRMFVESDGIANSVTVNSGGYLYIDSNGRASNLVISSGGTMLIVSCGVANYTTANPGAMMVIYSGGTANHVEVFGDGKVIVNRDATASIVFNPWNNITSRNGANITYLERDANVYFGGTSGLVSKADVMENLNVDFGNSALVYSGGTATIAFNPWQGKIESNTGANITYLERDANVYFGGTSGLVSKADVMENLNVESGNSILVYSGGIANSTFVKSGGVMLVSANGIVNSFFVSLGGLTYISSGGTANNTTVLSNGFMSVASGGTAAHIVASSGALLDFSVAPDTYIEGENASSAFEIKEGIATYYSVNSGNILRISSDGVASRAYVYAGGSLFVSNGGTARRTTVSNGTMSILSGGVADSTTVNGGCLHVSSGGVASNITNNGSVIVSSGAMIDAVNVKNECWLYVSSGGTATNVTASSTKLCFDVAPDTFIVGTSNGSSFEIKDGIVSDYGVYQNGRLNILSGCTANNITVNLSGFMGVEGTANSVTIHGSGYVTVSSGGLVNSVTVNNYGRMYVSGGTANYTTVNDGKYCYVSVFSGTADYAIVNGGSMLVSNGTVNYATVNGGYMRVFSGTADNAIVNGGSMYVSGGSASNVSISKGTLRLGACIASDTKVYSGGIVSTQQTRFTGKITIADGGVIHAGQGTVIDFDISRLAPRMGVLLNNLSLIQDDAPAFTLTVSDLQWNGTYKLAQGVTEFDNLISVKSTDSETIHMVAVDETANVDGIEYTLKLTGGTLAVTVTGGVDIPVIPVSADKIEITNQDVTLTAGFSGDAIMREYSFDNETWHVYTEPVKCTVNGTVYFLGKDQRGFINEIGNYEITNIDKVAPEKPNVSADITTVTNQNVTVTAEFTDDIDLASKLFRLGANGAWSDYTNGVTVTENTTVHFKAVDKAGNESEEASCVVNNIDKVAPEKPTVSADITETTYGNVNVSAVFSADSVKKEYSLDNGSTWQDYTAPIEFTANGTVLFRGIDAADNASEVVSYEVVNIETVIPDTTKPTVTNTKANITAPTNQAVTVTADFADDIELTRSLYRIGETDEWTDYTDGVIVSENTTVYFKAIDAAGNESEVASYTVGNIDNVDPSAPSGLMAVVSDLTVVLIWNPSTDDASGIKEYVVNYSRNGQEFTAAVNNTNYVLTGLASGSWTWSVQAVDLAGNKSTMTSGNSFGIAGTVVEPEPVSDVAPQTQTWKKTEATTQYVVEYSMDNFEHVIRLAVASNSLDSFQMPAGNYQWRVKPEGGEDWTVGEPLTATEADSNPKLVKSNEDGNDDLFFAKAIDTWEAGYMAQHVGAINDWNGTIEYASVYGKNKLADIIEGSTDANILLMSDDDNGDALFVDDIYTALPGSVPEQQSRIAKIDEIRAGSGDDIIDMTSQRFEYIGTGLTIRGGAGNDTIWANKGDNFLFGDAGNDRIVGASGNDVIAGGIGNDRMHGGGGNDVFTFCDNWGVDNVEQLASGKVTLWFSSGDESKWNADTLTYTDGVNSVRVTGVASVELKFGDDASELFATLAGMGAFLDSTSERIFEESGKGTLASL